MCFLPVLFRPHFGGVAERFKAAVLKTADCNRSVSSNLTASAISIEQRPRKCGAFVFPTFALNVSSICLCPSNYWANGYVASTGCRGHLAQLPKSYGKDCLRLRLLHARLMPNTATRRRGCSSRRCALSGDSGYFARQYDPYLYVPPLGRFIPARPFRITRATGGYACSGEPLP